MSVRMYVDMSHLLQLYRFLKEFCRTSAGLPKDFCRTFEGLWALDFMVYKIYLVYKSQPPGLRDLFFIELKSPAQLGKYVLSSELRTFERSSLIRNPIKILSNLELKF